MICIGSEDIRYRPAAGPDRIDRYDRGRSWVLVTLDVRHFPMVS
jgi:hypothetical protein